MTSEKLATDRYVREEWTVLPKAAAITVGGMAGFVLGMRRYGIRKFLYATGGILTMAAFCYPHETVDIVRVGVAHAQRTYEDFQKCKRCACLNKSTRVYSFSARAGRRKEEEMKPTAQWLAVIGECFSINP